MNLEYCKLHADLLNRLADELSRGVKLLDVLDDESYTRTKNGIGSIGAHIRHNLDFADNFLIGIENGQIDYNRRERDPRVEKDRRYAKERFLFLIQRLKSLSDEILDLEVSVCSEVNDANWYKSTGARELEFVHSHTVHHYALIAEKLCSHGTNVSVDFGVAPSTLQYWAEQDKKAKVA